MQKNKTTIILSIVSITFLVIGLLGCISCQEEHKPRHHKYKKTQTENFREENHETRKYSKGRNTVEAIILHHTALTGDIQGALFSLCESESMTSCHVLIDYDGTRYLLASPDKITWHAGRSVLNGKESANKFAIGIEFQGNTLEKPLTEEQIYSAIEYIIPIIEEYHIKLENIVTHGMIRQNWIDQYPDYAERYQVPEKIDITEEEYSRFMETFMTRLYSPLMPKEEPLPSLHVTFPDFPFNESYF